MNPDERKWVQVFLEIALRAIRRVHLEYGIWGAGRQWKIGPHNVADINMGHGVELADERTVCAAISHEFMVSPSVTGMWQEEGQSDLRFFGIQREQRYSTPAPSGRARLVDLVVEKYEHKSNGYFVVDKPRSYIEAKRVRVWRADLKTAAVEVEGTQTDRIVADINKLREERKILLEKGETIFIHLLIWGIYQDTPDGKSAERSDDPFAFFTDLRTKTDATLEGPYVRWLPIKWDNPTPDSKTRVPVVSRFAWVALSEIDRPEEDN